MTIDQTQKLMAMTKMFFIKEIIGLSYFLRQMEVNLIVCLEVDRRFDWKLQKSYRNMHLLWVFLVTVELFFKTSKFVVNFMSSQLIHRLIWSRLYIWYSPIIGLVAGNDSVYFDSLKCTKKSCSPSRQSKKSESQVILQYAFVHCHYILFNLHIFHLLHLALSLLIFISKS